MKQKREDRRIKYTKLALRQSLLALMAERPVHKISVTDLCVRADVNRNTFYAHSGSPQDLLLQIEDELSEQIHSSIQRSLKAETIPVLIMEICQAIAANVDLCRVLLSDHGDKEFLKRVMRIAHDETLQDWRAGSRQQDAEQFEKLFTFIANGSVAVIQAWMQGGMRESAQDVARFIEKMTNYGLAAFLRAD